jgi:hypothetical protein
MNFDKIDSSIQNSGPAEKKLQSLALELGVRHDNQFVGSGLGGNNPQLFALMSFHNELVDDPKLTIKVKKGTIRWGSTWLARTKMSDIRSELDSKLPVSKSATLDQIRNDARYSLGPNVAAWDALVDACKACADLASDLDKGNETKIGATASVLKNHNLETILVSVRTQIQIDRLVRHNLDEHPEFGKLLSNVNKNID